jgi:hypothetical protein
MKFKQIIFSLLVLALISADIPPAHVQGYLYPDSCKRPGYLNMPSRNYNGEILDVYVNGVVVASAEIGGRVFITEDGTRIIGSHNWFDLTIPGDGLAIFVLRDNPAYPWGAVMVHPGDELTINLCGAMPMVRVKKGHG